MYKNKRECPLRGVECVPKWNDYNMQQFIWAIQVLTERKRSPKPKVIFFLMRGMLVILIRLTYRYTHK